MHSSARMGLPAATLPRMGTWSFGAGASVRAMARPFPAPLAMTPASSRCLRWKWTVEGDLRPTASPISRTEGGYPWVWMQETM